MRWRRILIALVVCVALAAIVFSLPTREPKYQGRTLSEWITLSAPRPSPEPETTRAAEAVRHIGTNAIPSLIRWLNYKEQPSWKRMLFAGIDKLPGWMQNRLTPYSFTLRSYQIHRRLALDGFLILGPAASPAVPDLLKIGNAWAEGPLDSIGLAGVAPTLTVLTNRANATPLRASAARWIGVLSQKYEINSVIPVLTQTVRDSEPAVAKESAMALVKLTAEPDLTVAFFTDLLQHGDVLSRCEAAESLRELREKARPAVPVLVNALKDEDWYVRRAATITLYRLDPDALDKAIPGSVAVIRNTRAFGD